MPAAYKDDVRFPFTFESGKEIEVERKGNDAHTATISFPNARGRLPSSRASRLRSMMIEAYNDRTKILAVPCSYDALSSRLVEEAGFPILFISGYTVSSSHGLPDTGYIAMQEMCDKIQETSRVTSVPIIADGDTGYGGPVNVKRTVESFALAGAAGVMIEDQSWPKRCGHTKGKSVVPREEAFARIQAACDARDNGLDIFILARTDSLILGWEEAIYRAKEFQRIGADGIFIEALPDREAMKRAVKEVQMPMLANIIDGGMTENLSALELAELGFSAVAYPFMLVAAKLKSIRETLQALKTSLPIGPPPTILSAAEVCEGVGFNKYWALEDRYATQGAKAKAALNGNHKAIGISTINGH
ncbi:carboxyvinyl-carboxyphosphonate phosphorylmutase [Fusarium mundagurra]|uniref:Carboxyvinyl-carboxyphosphonate phosphorylmutase n=1 Tax=Fusarium mundagurra TaxID=1567541 RepID=A0A8H5XWH6_9HYPO|nr:carboxyvinyl-carboxyphosphonate phosphorylmutase [Fusarium mundagurra]